jgi:Bacterial protein of unknown function (DUF899)
VTIAWAAVVSVMAEFVHVTTAGAIRLIVYRAFYAPDVTTYPQGGGAYPQRACVGCSFLADQVAHPAHLNARDTTLAFVSRAPQAEIQGLKERMGWDLIPWYTITDDFDKDFGVDEWHGTNAFIRDGERIHRTYFVDSRGDEAMGSTWSYLDITVAGPSVMPPGGSRPREATMLSTPDVGRRSLQSATNDPEPRAWPTDRRALPCGQLSPYRGRNTRDPRRSFRYEAVKTYPQRGPLQQDRPATTRASCACGVEPARGGLAASPEWPADSCCWIDGRPMR